MDYFTVFIILLLLLLICKSNEFFNLELNNKNNATNTEKFNNSNNMKITLYYTNWCGYSVEYINSVWNNVVSRCEEENIISEMINCEENTDICNNKKIIGYPTIMLSKNDNESEFKGDRNNIETMINTLKNM